MENTASKILAEIMNYRRVPKLGDSCGDSNCPRCRSVHLPKIEAAIQKHEPVTFVLPAFPGKSPNLEKVLGPLPDQAEHLSLKFLGELCRRIKCFYLPGIKIILCSDGRVFSDIVGMKEGNVSLYQSELNELLNELGISDITTFNLEDVYGDQSFSQMRDELMKQFGIPLDVLKHKIQNEDDAHRMYCGITRFLFEDAIFSEQTKSRSAIQKEARLKAYEVIRRSNAWGELIAKQFPEAVRLSIHPQGCGSLKLGIRLISNETWMTPWHGVVVETAQGHILLKRSEAEKLGAQIVYSHKGEPSHYTLIARNFAEHTEAIYAV